MCFLRGLKPNHFCHCDSNASEGATIPALDKIASSSDSSHDRLTYPLFYIPRNTIFNKYNHIGHACQLLANLAMNFSGRLARLHQSRVINNFRRFSNRDKTLWLRLLRPVAVIGIINYQTPPADFMGASDVQRVLYWQYLSKFLHYSSQTFCNLYCRLHHPAYSSKFIKL